MAWYVMRNDVWRGNDINNQPIEKQTSLAINGIMACSKKSIWRSGQRMKSY